MVQKEQVADEKLPHWEFTLTVKLLRENMRDAQSRWHSLKEGLYTKPVAVIRLDEAVDWHKAKLEELIEIVASIQKLLGEQLSKAWGKPGMPGSAVEIQQACELVGNACSRLIEWEESVRFASVPHGFEGVRNQMVGTAGRQLDNISLFPEQMAVALEQPNPQGKHEIDVLFDLPSGWATRMTFAIRSAEKKL